ncbi:MAG TPA: hypothetical protein VK558_12745 [Patescibacteria group bacterium]|nr:hypothetical protein [Patescibacteria group bacterium]
MVLGKGTVIAALADLPGERTGLAVEGCEGRILTLLSIARDDLAHPQAFRTFAVASNALAGKNGDRVLFFYSEQPALFSISTVCYTNSHTPRGTQ